MRTIKSTLFAFVIAALATTGVAAAAPGQAPGPADGPRIEQRDDARPGQSGRHDDVKQDKNRPGKKDNKGKNQPAPQKSSRDCGPQRPGAQPQPPAPGPQPQPQPQPAPQR